MELLVTPAPEGGSKEEYRAMIEALMVTRVMLNEAEAASEETVLNKK